MLAGKYQRNPYLPLIFVICRNNGAKDWFTGTVLSSTNVGPSHRLELHHIFPKEMLDTVGDDEHGHQEVGGVGVQQVKQRLSPLLEAVVNIVQKAEGVPLVLHVIARDVHVDDVFTDGRLQLGLQRRWVGVFYLLAGGHHPGDDKALHRLRRVSDGYVEQPHAVAVMVEDMPQFRDAHRASAYQWTVWVQQRGFAKIKHAVLAGICAGETGHPGRRRGWRAGGFQFSPHSFLLYSPC